MLDRLMSDLQSGADSDRGVWLTTMRDIGLSMQKVERF